MTINMNKNIDIHLRGINPKTIALIDQQVAELNQNKDKRDQISRNQFIISLLDDQAMKPLLDYERTEYEKTLNQSIDLLHEYIRATNRVLYLLATGDTSVALNLYDDMSNINLDDEENKNE